MSSDPQPDLDALVLAMNRGDARARDRLILIADETLRRHFRRVGGADAEDLHQAAVETVVATIGGFTLPEADGGKTHPFLRWVARIGKNKVGNSRRKKQLVLVADMPAELVDEQPRPDKQVDLQRRADKANEHVERMRCSWREAIDRQLREGCHGTEAERSCYRRALASLTKRFESETPLNMQS
ncbi:MAG: hypothetical protein HC927_04835 [Deltaproteobacteria bacterium]|nr:hypothetical protein [Deltaproteobacteria bacterium]